MTYRSYYACPKVLPLEFMNIAGILFGGVLILFGLVMTLYGTKFIVLIISIMVGSVAMLIGFYFSYYAMGLYSKENEKQLAIACVLCFVGGLIVACKFFSRFRKNVIWLFGIIMGMWIGKLVSMAAVNSINNNCIDCEDIEDYKAYVIFGCLVIGALLGFTFGYKFKSNLSRFGTALIGAYLTVRGFAMYFGEFPESFKIETSGDLDRESILNPAQYKGKVFWIYMISFVLLFIIGAIFQYKKWPIKVYQSLEDDEDDDDAF